MIERYTPVTRDRKANHPNTNASNPGNTVRGGLSQQNTAQIGGEISAEEAWPRAVGNRRVTTADQRLNNTKLVDYEQAMLTHFWAPLYTTKLEVGKTAVLIGRGTGRGSDVNVNGTLHGWHPAGSGG